MALPLTNPSPQASQKLLAMPNLTKPLNPIKPVSPPMKPVGSIGLVKPVKPPLPVQASDRAKEIQAQLAASRAAPPPVRPTIAPAAEMRAAPPMPPVAAPAVDPRQAQMRQLAASRAMGGINPSPAAEDKLSLIQDIARQRAALGLPSPTAPVDPRLQQQRQMEASEAMMRAQAAAAPVATPVADPRRLAQQQMLDQSRQMALRGFGSAMRF